jgi:hypothetical protein
LSQPPEKLKDGTDLEKLAKAVAMHETKDCTLGNSALVHNNAFGIMQWDSQGNRSFKKYESCEESYEDFERIWKTHYRVFPNEDLAKIYSGNDRHEAWLANVTKFYNSL